MMPCFAFQSFKNHSKKELMNKKTIWLLQAAGLHLQEHCAAAPQHLQAASPGEFLPPASPWHCPKHLWHHRPHDGALCHSCPGFSAEGQDESQIHSPDFKIKRKDIFLFPSFFSQAPAHSWTLYLNVNLCAVHFHLPPLQLLSIWIKHLLFYTKACTKVVIIPVNNTKGQILISLVYLCRHVYIFVLVKRYQIFIQVSQKKLYFPTQGWSYQTQNKTWKFIRRYLQTIP